MDSDRSEAPGSLQTITSAFYQSLYTVNFKIMSSVPAGQPIELPAVDNTLGALYIGSSLSTVLYGVICVQTFLYVTSNRAQYDSWAMKLLVFILCSKAHLNRSGLDTTQQCPMLAGMYRLLITDYANPDALETGGPSSGLAFVTYLTRIQHDEAIVAICSILLVQLFFCWRIWTFSASSLHLHVRIAIIAVVVSLAFLNFASYICLSIFGFRDHLFTGPGHAPDLTLSWKISGSSGIAFDVITTMAMTLSLYRWQSLTMKRSNHVIVVLIVLIVNTNLITTLLSIGALITYLVLPNGTIYGGIYLLLHKSYLNSFLAILNSREFLREKMDHQSQPGQSSIPDFAAHTPTDATSTTGEQFELSLVAAVGNGGEGKLEGLKLQACITSKELV
ncbi:hypothetical protein ARMGADRAFT_1056978 [Armillaria gallica]|uniref:DUF6534 domain-containing protein n=1 Tax=Armillaria gallica TaxID=47427 RepID=A0A2H3E9C0_ARMGA|nr:hypothetical protein ARMGADRAFT_1056978 [Armillaria gallica]